MWRLVGEIFVIRWVITLSSDETFEAGWLDVSGDSLSSITICCIYARFSPIAAVAQHLTLQIPGSKEIYQSSINAVRT